MNMSVTLFQVDDNRFSALAFDVDHQGNVWMNSYGSRKELIRSLENVGAVTAEEVEELQDRSCFAKGSPVLRVSIDREAIEGASFKRVLSSTDVRSRFEQSERGRTQRPPMARDLATSKGLNSRHHW